MTLLFMDGCQGGDTASKWDSGSSGTRVTSTPRFTGAAAIGNVTATKSFTAASEIFVAAAIYWSAASTNTWIAIKGDTGATTHLTIVRNSTSGFLELRRGTNAGTLLATGTTVIPLTAWTQLQVRATIADSGGVCQIRLNGSSTNEIDYTGDTKNAGTNTTIDQIGVSTSSAAYLLTDVAILNTSGSANNTWPGDVRVYTLSPSGNGNTSQGTNSATSNSTNNYQSVDELPYSSTDYVGVTTAGNGDSYAMSDLPAGVTTVLAAQVNINVAKSDAGAKSVKRRIRSGGTTYAGSAVLLGTSYVTVSEVLENDPATSAAWTPTNVNAAEVGFEAA